jgi:hypothetical protein
VGVMGGMGVMSLIAGGGGEFFSGGTPLPRWEREDSPVEGWYKRRLPAGIFIHAGRLIGRAQPTRNYFSSVGGGICGGICGIIAGAHAGAGAAQRVRQQPAETTVRAARTANTVYFMVMCLLSS